MPNLAAERMRRHRQRQRNGLRCFTVELRATEIESFAKERPSTDAAQRTNPVAEKTVLRLPAPLLQRHRRWLKAGLGYLRLQQ
jgi:hypothetical protein